MATFSVVITSFNRPQFLGECIQSVVEQTRPAEQILLIDDGSADEKWQEVARGFPQVTTISQVNLGRPIAANTGILHSTSDYICFLDDDDLWHRDKLACAEDYLDSNPDCDALNHPVWFFSEEFSGSAVELYRDFTADSLKGCHDAVEAGDPSIHDWSYMQTTGDSFRRYLARNCGGLSASIVRRDILIRAGGFNPSQTYADDWMLFLNVARLSEWHTVGRRLGFNRLHSGQDTRNAVNGLRILVAYNQAWFGGRPFPDHGAGLDALEELMRYRIPYRRFVHEAVWSALYERRWRLAQYTRRLGRNLLPGRRDWWYVHVPPPITHRIRRLMP